MIYAPCIIDDLNSFKSKYPWTRQSSVLHTLKQLNSYCISHMGPKHTHYPYTAIAQSLHLHQSYLNKLRMTSLDSTSPDIGSFRLIY